MLITFIAFVLRSGQNYDGWTGVTLNAPVIVMAGHKVVKNFKKTK